MVKRLRAHVAVRNRYTGCFTDASIWEILSLIVLFTRDPRRTSTHQLAEHEDCIKENRKFVHKLAAPHASIAIR